MKKILLFIVEGRNDKREIEAILRATCDTFTDHYSDYYIVRNNDITAEKDTSEKNIVQKINNIVIDWRNGKGGEPNINFLPSDIQKIVHVVDTDGVFIPDSAVIEDEDVGEFEYHDQTISFFNRNKIIIRNQKKAKVLRRLLEVKRVDNILYELYFASCNMDHVLFNTRNPKRSEKDQNSFVFASKCKTLDDLKDSVFAEGVAFSGTIPDSWKMIQEDFNSLERHTNLNILLKDIIELNTTHD